MQWASGHFPNDLGVYSDCTDTILGNIPPSIPYGWCTGQYSVLELTDAITGMCVPEFCTEQEMQNDTVFQLLLSAPQSVFSQLTYVEGSARVHCINSSPKASEVTSVRAFFAMMGLFALLCVVATVLHVHGNSLCGHKGREGTIYANMDNTNQGVTKEGIGGSKESTMEFPVSSSSSSKWRERLVSRLVLAWNMPHNINRLVSSPPADSKLDLSPLNGVRVLAMTWVILGHTVLFGLGAYQNQFYVFSVPIKRYKKKLDHNIDSNNIKMTRT